MSRHALCAGLILVLACVPSVAHAQVPTATQAVRDAETAFRNIMEAWAYDQFWKMWEMGTEASQFSISQNDFSDRMRLAGTKPAAGKQVEAIRVSLQAPTSALVSVRFTLETRTRRLVQFVWNFAAYYDGAVWRLDLNDFLKLINYNNY